MPRPELPVKYAMALFTASEATANTRFALVAALEAAGLAGWHVLCKDGYGLFAGGLIVAVTIIGTMLFRLSYYDRQDSWSYHGRLKAEFAWPEREPLPWLLSWTGKRPIGLRGRDALHWCFVVLLVLNLLAFFWIVGGGCVEFCSAGFN